MALLFTVLLIWYFETFKILQVFNFVLFLIVNIVKLKTRKQKSLQNLLPLFHIFLFKSQKQNSVMFLTTIMKFSIEITGDPHNLIRFHKCDLFMNYTIFCSTYKMRWKRVSNPNFDFLY